MVAPMTPPRLLLGVILALLVSPVARAQPDPDVTDDPDGGTDAAEAGEPEPSLEPEPSVEPESEPELESEPEPDTTVDPPHAMGASVVGLRHNDAIIDRGRGPGLAPGARMELYREEAVDLGDGEIAYERHRLAVGEIVALTGRRALVRLAPNEFVEVGDGAGPTADPLTGSRVRPPRTGGYWYLDATARVFVTTRAVGGGLLGDAELGYRGERPFILRLRVPSAGFTIHRDRDASGLDSASAGAVFAMAGLDLEYVSVGAGFGLTRVLPKEIRGPEVRLADATLGFSFVLFGRLGTQDGLHVATEVGLTTLVDSSELSHLAISLQVPLTQQLALVSHGGTGFAVTGAGYVDFGARLRVRGEGGSGTLFVSPFLGFARVAERAEWWGTVDPVTGAIEPSELNESSRVRGGPSAGVRVEYRL